MGHCFLLSSEHIPIPFCTNIMYMYAYHISFKLLFYFVLINDLYDDLCYKVFCCKRNEKCSEVTTGDVTFVVFFIKVKNKIVRDILYYKKSN